MLNKLSEDVIIAVSVSENIRGFNDPTTKNEHIKNMNMKVAGTLKA